MAIFLLLPDSVRMQTDSLTLPNSAGYTVGLDTFGFGQAPIKWEFDEWALTKPFSKILSMEEILHQLV